MMTRVQHEARWLALAMSCAIVAPALAQQQHTQGGAASQATVSSSTVKGKGDSAEKPADGLLVDQVVAVVNDDLVLESDVELAQRFAAFQPLQDRSKESRDQLVEQLVNRQLILQQAKLQPDSAVSTAEVNAQIAALRKEIPACAQYHCETDAGWQRFVRDRGLTMPELTQMVTQQIQLLKFTEMRFRTGIRIPQSDIQNYYDKTLLPEYARQHAPAPKLDVIADRIQQILLEKQVSSLLNDWLQSLKAQGSVRIMRPGEVQP
jgi:uncharacterized small protein (DUF1192 family)